MRTFICTILNSSCYIAPEPSAVRLPRTSGTSIADSRTASQVSLMVSHSRNPETATLSTVATLANYSVIAGASSTSTLLSQTEDTCPQLAQSNARAAGVFTGADVEQTQQQNLMRMLAEDPAPSFRALFTHRSRSRRRRAVDGGAPVNRSGPQRSGSPVPTTVSTLATGDSIGASTLPPAYIGASTLPPAYAQYS